jgi:hypothetical protein
LERRALNNFLAKYHEQLTGVEINPMLRAFDFSVTNHHRNGMKTANIRPSNYRIAILFMAFMACSLTLLCYQSRLSRILPLDTTNQPLVKSIKMAHERDTLSALDCATGDDAGNKLFDHALGAFSDNEVLAPIPSPPGAMPDLHLNLIAHSVYRRPPPTWRQPACSVSLRHFCS